MAERFGSLRRAFAVIQQITDLETWESIARRRREDILVYLALARFRKRPALSLLPHTLQRDMRAFFGSYTKACAEADALLFTAGDADAVEEACKRSSIGKLLPDDLYVHRSALNSLDPLLRIYEGCGRAYLGEVEGANIIKIHRRTGKAVLLGLPGLRRGSPPCPSALREAEPADAADRMLRLLSKPEPAGAAPQGILSAPLRPAVREVRSAYRSRRKARPAG